MAKSQRFFGHQAFAAQLASRLRRHFAADSLADDSLVIGLFGEWGCGKSNLLQLVRESFTPAGVHAEQPPVVVVSFNPWRYEKEEHLLVPLLKTMELAIEQHILDNQSIWTTDISGHMGAFARFLGVSAIAFMQAFKAKYSNDDLGIEVEFEPAKFIEGARNWRGKKPTPPKTAMDKLASYYFEFEHRLREYTTGDDAIRLLFLIDDLDRCLPEKAVEMLESIKLFLDVEGCAFVLALDDEVVERGIVHRYRDYIFQGNGQRQDEKSLAQLPITGPEYLEKIIHLPFRLPQPSRIEIRRFLRERYPELFENRPAEMSPEFAGEAFKSAGRPASRHASPQQADALLDLFSNHIPPVPRKQIRTAELLLLLLDMARERQCEQRIQRLPLAKLTLLQLYAPEIYRFGRRRFSGFMQTLQEWSGQEGWAQRDFAECMKTRINTPADGEQALNESRQIEMRNFDRFYAPLIEALEACAQNRSGFDPFQFIKSHPLSTDDMQDMRCYFSFVDEIGLGNEERETAARLGQELSLPVAELANADEFLDLLFSPSEGSWQSAVQQPELEGRTLGDALFERLMQRLRQADFAHLRQNAGWLKRLVPHLDRVQFSRLADMAEGLREFLPASLPEQPTDEQAEPLFAVAELLAAMRPDQQAVLADSVQAMRNWLTAIVEKHQLAVKLRAEAGRLLSELGDPRPGVTVQRKNGQPIVHQRGDKQHALPDIGWQAIPAGRLRMGTDGEEGYNHEKPAHEVDVPGFFISRYPVTNAQYRCFIDAGLYEDLDFWREKLPKAAGRWLEGGEADEKLLQTIAEEYRESYRRWLTNDKQRQTPYYWADKQWNLDNHPVVGVSWFEALAYSVWLNEIQAEVGPAGGSGLCIRLPSEVEWEYAARGEQGLRYAWGDKEDATAGNYADTGLQRTSTVGLFAPGQAFGLYDMSGNVWEWALSRWGADWNKPDFIYSEWQQQEKERNRVEPVEFRISRGGSWYNSTDLVRCAVRSGVHPNYRSYDLGFRLLCGAVLPG